MVSQPPGKVRIGSATPIRTAPVKGFGLAQSREAVVEGAAAGTLVVTTPTLAT